MDTREISREQISALADGELVDAHVNVALAVLREPEEQITWDLYHQIGDVLRSDEMAFALSDGFSAKMRARLDAEPAMIAPQLNRAVAEQIILPVAANGAAAGMRQRKQFMRRFVMPGAAVAAAVVAVVFVIAPQQSALMASGSPASVSPQAVVADAAGAAAVAPGAITTVSAVAPSVPSAMQVSSLAQQGEVARDPRIDDYLLAHQRFSPSMYSSAQYARSAGFAIDSDK
jgi:sigma-E factor negative regulatory protein RseA